MYKLYLAVFLLASDRQDGSCSTLCCQAPLGCIVYKIRSSKRHTKPKYFVSK